MADKIIELGINPVANRLVEAQSRYRDSDVILLGNKRKMTFKIYKRIDSDLNPNDTFAVITPGSEYKPYNVAYKFYGVPEIWWKILEVNNIKDIYDFKAGLTIRLPANIWS